MIMSVRFLLAILLLLLSGKYVVGAGGSETSKYASFSLVSYRTEPMVRYLVRSKAWKKNRPLSILDYGCGGGALARHIASLDKTARVVAVDVNQNVVEAAKLRLRPFPNASAQHLWNVWPFAAGSLRGLRWFQQFDIVVSLMGALHAEQKTKVKRVSVVDATKEAALACRKGGHVIQGEWFNVRLLSMAESFSVCLVRYFFPRLPWPQTVLYVLLWNLLGTIADLSCSCHGFGKRFGSRMKQAGLTNITWSLRSFFPYFSPHQIIDDLPSDSVWSSAVFKIRMFFRGGWLSKSLDIPFLFIIDGVKE